jgi:hypothetical protein
MLSSRCPLVLSIPSLALRQRLDLNVVSNLFTDAAMENDKPDMGPISKPMDRKNLDAIEYASGGGVKISKFSDVINVSGPIS